MDQFGRGVPPSVYLAVMHNVVHSRSCDQTPDTTGNDGVPTVILRREPWESACVAAGLITAIDRAAFLQVTTKHIRGVETGKALPGREFIARVLNAFPRSQFDDLFAVQIREAS